MFSKRANKWVPLFPKRPVTTKRREKRKYDPNSPGELSEDTSGETSIPSEGSSDDDDDDDNNKKRKIPTIEKFGKKYFWSQ